MRKIWIYAAALASGAALAPMERAVAFPVTAIHLAVPGLKADAVVYQKSGGHRSRRALRSSTWRSHSWRASVAPAPAGDSPDKAQAAEADAAERVLDRRFMARFAEEPRIDNNAGFVALVLTRIGRLVSMQDDDAGDAAPMFRAPLETSRMFSAPLGDAAEAARAGDGDVASIGRLSARWARKITSSDVAAATAALSGASEQIRIRDLASGWTASALSGSGK